MGKPNPDLKNRLSGIFRSWWQDQLLRDVARSSGYLFSSNSVMAVLSMVQGILVVRLVGIEGLGVITTITAFASNIHRFVSFRMSEVVVKHLGEAVEQNNNENAISVIRWAGSVEIATSLFALLLFYAFTPWAAQTLVGNTNTVRFFWVYGLVITGNIIYETSVGVLQTLRRFDYLAKVNVTQSIITAVVILVAFLTGKDILFILTAYLFGKIAAGLLIFRSAWLELLKLLGKKWWRVKPSENGMGRKLFLFALNTNLHGTVNLFVRDNIPLMLGALRSQTEVGYYKLALSIINLVMLPIEPFIWPTYAEITRTIANRQWIDTRRLLRRVSTIAAGWTVAAGGAVVLFGPWLIPLVYGVSAAPSYPAAVILLVGYGFANIFNWNRPLLLALGKPSFPLMVAVVIGIIEIFLILLLVPHHGYLMLAGILSGYFVISITIIVWRGFSLLNKEMQEG